MHGDSMISVSVYRRSHHIEYFYVLTPAFVFIRAFLYHTVDYVFLSGMPYPPSGLLEGVTDGRCCCSDEERKR